MHWESLLQVSWVRVGELTSTGSQERIYTELTSMRGVGQNDLEGLLSAIYTFVSAL